MNDSDENSTTAAPGGSPGSTTRLVLLAREGDPSARERLASRFLMPLRRFAHGRLPANVRGMIETDDLVQVTLVRALNHMESFEPRRPGAFLAYLRQILVNQIRDEIRRATRRPETSEWLTDVASPAPSPLEEAIGLDSLRVYEAALARLTSEQQEAVIMRIELGFSHAEIAEAIGSPSANAARMTVARAVARLSELMREARGEA